MNVISAQQVEAALDWESLIERLRQAFRRGLEAPARHHHEIPGDGTGGTLLIMPAWDPGRHIGVKLVTVFPGNGEFGLPAIMGAYLLNDGRTGRPLALIDGPMLTVKRTAAASALASSYLSRSDSRRLLMIGTGAMAPYLIGAHAAVRPIREVLIWGRSLVKAERLADSLKTRRWPVKATDDLEAAVGGADIISCATLSREPLVRGAWLRPGQHVDLVGAFKPDMRESDDQAIKLSRVFVDTYEGALSEAGDIVQALESGAFTPDDIAGDLHQLTRGERAGRRYYNQITLFKSVGASIEDLAAAQLALERA